MLHNQKAAVTAECAVMAALASVLSLSPISLPYGGSVTLCSMLPIALISYRHGIGVGSVTGLLYAVIQCLLGINNLMYVPTAAGILLCILLDYLLPFCAIGLAGMFRHAHVTDKVVLNRMLTFCAGIAVVVIFRYLCHVLSGVVIWHSLVLAWHQIEPDHPVNRYGAWAFSAVYNGTFMLPEFLLTLIGGAAVSCVNALMEVKKRK